MTGALIESLRGNDLFAGGLLLMLLGSTLTLLYRVLPVAGRLLVRRFTVSLEVRDTDIFGWIGDWLGRQQYGSNCRRISVELLHIPVEGRGYDRFALYFAPGRGLHVFRYCGRWFWLERGVERDVGNSFRPPREYYVLRTAGTDVTVLKEAVRDAARVHEERRQGRVAVYCLDRNDGWERLELQENRPLDSLVLRDGVAEGIVADLEAFLSSASWYREMGIPHRRGYLFHGPPGCGKTSFASALAAHFQLNIYLVGIAANGMSDERLAVELGRTRARSVLLLEDVDTAFAQRARGAENRSQVTFSGLLNAMDGVAAREHRVFILTTNHPDRLDPALIRPGRVDVQQHFGYADRDQVRRLFLRFFPGAEPEAGGAARLLEGQQVSHAWLQNLLLGCRGRSPADAAAAIVTGAELLRRREHHVAADELVPRDGGDRILQH
jgi:mitochondrial chaperone BCS1